MVQNDIFGLLTKAVDLSLINSIQLDRIIGNSRNGFIDEYSLFLALFSTVPNKLYDSSNNCKASLEWFLSNYTREITDSYFDFTNQKLRFYKSKHAYDDPADTVVLSEEELLKGNAKKTEPRFSNIYLTLYEDTLITFDIKEDVVRILYRKTPLEKVITILDGIRKFPLKEKGDAAEINLLVNSDFGIQTKKIPVNRPKLNIEDNYNDDFKPIHNTILKKLNEDNEKGVVILHGKPGTGKTNYIRYLITSIQKNIIFLPPNMAASMVNPEFINLLTENINSVLVIEDAESILIDRKANGGSPVSALLNIADGLLSDCLSIQIVCSFNTDISKIDTALLRKGRLIGKYEFNELSVEKSQSLSDKLGFKTTITEPMTLAAIYNQDDLDFSKEKKNSIGFMK